jgi:serine-type D-Ala-D-Ala carboxypeptidase/endopeptidase
VRGSPGRRQVAPFVAILLASAPLPAQWSAPASAVLAERLTQRVASGIAVGMVVGVLESGRPRVVAAGRRGSAATPPPDATTLFEIGSISKLFTTTLLAEMVERGEVRLTDPVQQYLPAGVRVPSRSGRAITLLHLATSASGLPWVPPGEPRDAANPYAHFHEDDLYAFLAGFALPRDPGSAYEYSNVGMGLLGHVLARRAGRSYEQLIIERVLTPLGMHDTRITLSPAQRARLAIGHNADLDVTPYWDFAVLAGAGGWRSTARDMLSFLAAVLDPPATPLGRALTMATQPQRATNLPNMSIGLGWHLIERRARRIVWHNGATGGFHAFIGYDPASRANAVILSNSAIDHDDLGFHLIDSTTALRALPPARTVAAVDSLLLERHVGEYELAPGFNLTITRMGRTLYAQATGQSRFRLFPLSPTHFFLRAVEAEIIFDEADAGETRRVVLHQGGSQAVGRRKVLQGRRVTITTADGGLVVGDHFGEGARGIVLVHGGRYTRAHWGSLPDQLARDGAQVLAIDLRGYGESPLAQPPQIGQREETLDVMAAAQWLRARGASSVSVVGASLGGAAVASGAVHAQDAGAPFDAIVLLSPSRLAAPEQLPARVLWVGSAADTTASGALRLTAAWEDYRRLPGPKAWHVLNGNAHGQELLLRGDSTVVLQLVRAFLQRP